MSTASSRLVGVGGGGVGSVGGGVGVGVGVMLVLMVLVLIVVFGLMPVSTLVLMSAIVLTLANGIGVCRW